MRLRRWETPAFLSGRPSHSLPALHNRIIEIQPTMSVYEKAKEAAEFLKSRLPASLQNPQAAIVCGSGLSGLANTVEAEPRAEFDYASIPHFPRPTGKFLQYE